MLKRGTRMASLRRALALAPLLALFAALPSQVMMRCRFDGQVRAACCCPSAAEGRPQQAQTTLNAAACCDRLEVAGESVPGEQTRPTRAQHQAATLVALVSHRVVGLLPLDLRPLASSVDGRAPPGAPVASVLLKQAFLI